MDKMVLVSIFLISGHGVRLPRGRRWRLVSARRRNRLDLSMGSFGSGTRVIINLSEQRAYLIEGGKVSLFLRSLQVSQGGRHQRVDFSVISKDIDHRSQSFGSIINGSGKIAIVQCNPRHPRTTLVFIIDPRQCHTTWNSARQLACTPVIFPGIPHPTDASGCLETSRNSFSNG